MANIFYLKKGDTYPNLVVTLSDENGAVNLTDCVITFRMSQPSSGNLMLEKSATILNQEVPANVGKCYVVFEDGDTDVVATYRVEWRVLFSNGKIATFPRGEGATIFNQIIIQEIVD